MCIQNPHKNQVISVLKSFFIKICYIDIGDDGVHTIWDQFLDLTCPAAVIADKEKGNKVGLGNHVQILEADTLISCDIKYKVNREIDEFNSFLTVYDDLDIKSTMTFRNGDYLSIDLETHDDLPSECDNIGIVRITEVKIIEREPQNNRNILSLKIKDPDAVEKYITWGKFDGLVNNQVIDNENGTRRRTLSTNPRVTIEISAEDTIEKERGITKTKRVNGVDWTFSSSGTLTSEYRAAFSFYVGLYLRIDAGLNWCCTRICWCFWGCCTNVCVPCGFYFEFQVELQAGYVLEFDYSLSFQASASLHMPRLLYLEKEMLAYIAGIPIKYRPWLQVDLLMETIPIHARAWIDCEYGHDVKIGYEYKSRGGGRGSYVDGM